MKEGWEYKKLGEVATYVNGFAFKPSDWTDNGLPIIRIQNLTNSTATFHRCNREDIPDKYKIKCGEILISWSATLGVYEWLGENALLNQHIFKVEFNKVNINKKYFEFAVKSSLSEMAKHTNGATMRHIRKGDFDNITIPVPSLSEQRSIVSYLDAAFAKIDAVAKHAEDSLNEAKALFQSALTKMMEPKEGWEERQLKDVCDIYGDYGLSVPSAPYSGVRYIRITDITDWGELNDGKVSADLSKGKAQEELKEGDILFARTGATVGKTLVYRDSFGQCLFAGYLIRYRLKKDIILPSFMFYITHSKEYYDWVKINQKAAAQPNIGAKLYNSYMLRFPSLDGQVAIVEKLDRLRNIISTLSSNLSRTLTECAALKQAILRQTFE